MPRVDIGDVQAAAAAAAASIDCGYPRGIERYDFGQELGKGGFGTVRVVKDKLTGKEYACKSIVKRLDVPNLSVSKQAAYLDNVKREIAVLRRLQGTLNVVHFVNAYEDDDFIHVVMEYCRGGELYNRIGRRFYSERVAASYMRGVLRTLAQCHSLRILHRDIKAGNFMLLNDDEGAPLKAIDFGLAVFFDPANLPRTDLGLEGTPWFMAPEVLSSNVLPASDVWAAGVLAYQLLCGSLPFDDPKASLPKIWKAILTQEPSFSGSAWQEISSEAKDFVRTILNKEPERRPTAREALLHPWLAVGGDEDRHKGKPLATTVIQRIQRFQQGNAFQRTIFEMIAQELLNMLPPPPPTPPDTSTHGTSSTSSQNGSLPKDDSALRPHPHPASGSGHGMYSALRGNLLSRLRRKERSQALLQGPGGGAVEGPPLLDRVSGSAHGGLEYYRIRGESAHGGQHYLANEYRSETVHGGGNYWRVLRAAAAAHAWRNGEGGKGEGSIPHLRMSAKMSTAERAGQRKAARLALDTSTHHGSDYVQFCEQITLGELQENNPYGSHHGSHHSRTFSGSHHNSRHKRSSDPGSGRPVSPGPGLPVPGRGRPAHPSPKRPMLPTPAPQDEERRHSLEEKGRGQRNFFDLMQSRGPSQLGDGGGGGARASRGREGVTFADRQREGARRPAMASTSPRDVPGSGPEPRTPADRGAPGSMASSDQVDFGRLRMQSRNGLSVEDDEFLPTIVEASPRSDRSNMLASSCGSQGNGSFASQLNVLGSSWGSEGSLQQEASSRHADRAVQRLLSGGSLHGQEEVEGGEALMPLQELRDIMRRLKFTREGEAVTAETLAEGLQHLGYRLAPSEVRVMTNRMRRGEAENQVPKSAFLASQIDWHNLLQNHREMWLEAAQRVFEGLEGSYGGHVSAEKLIANLRAKLPSTEVDYALEDALLEAGYANEEDLDFEGFVRLLQGQDLGELDQYDARLPRPASYNALPSLADMTNGPA